MHGASNGAGHGDVQVVSRLSLVGASCAGGREAGSKRVVLNLARRVDKRPRFDGNES